METQEGTEGTTVGVSPFWGLMTGETYKLQQTGCVLEVMFSRFLLPSPLVLP